MTITRRRFIAALVSSLLLFTLFLLFFMGDGFLRIGNAVPLILLPLVLSISFFYGDNPSIIAGLFAGILLDSSSANTSCFNTLFFVVVAGVTNLLAVRFLNRNLKAAICLSVGVSFGYYFLKYLVYFAFSGVSVTTDYFLNYLIPSSVYTAVWIIPFYFLQKKLSNY